MRSSSSRLSARAAILATLLGILHAARGHAADRSRHAPPFPAAERERILELSPLGPPPADPSNAFADDPRAARLGQRLFFERRLSPAGVSCATCHVPARGFSDGRRVSEGAGTGRRRTPSLWNVAYNRWYFRDGRADSLWSQALVPIEGATEMAGSRLRAAHLVADDPVLRAAYTTLFGPLPELQDAARFPGDGVPCTGGVDDPRARAWSGMKPDDRAAVDTVFANLGKAIEAYERRLVSRRSRFDRYAEGLRRGGGDPAFPDAARRGLEIFVGRGRCRVCHGGPNFTDGEFHATGVPPLDGAGRADAGRYAGIEPLMRSPFNLLGRFSDDRSALAGEFVRNLRRTPEMWGQFKTPSLRNVALDPPYMHQGGLATLRDVVVFYSTRAGGVAPASNAERVLEPLDLSDGEIDDLVAFLETLTDEEVDPMLLREPAGR